MLWRCLLVVFILAVSGPGSLADEAAMLAAQELYDSGAFHEAAAEAERLGTAAGYAFAARSMLAAAITGTRDKSLMDLVDRAEQHARAALAVDPNHVEANVQLALSLGFRGRHTGKLRAHFRGYARDGRAHLDRAYEMEPENAWVLSVLGGWHLEIVDRAGKRSADWLYKANREEGVAFYERALRIDPANVTIRHQFALQLAALNDDGDLARAAEVLLPVQEATSLNAFESVSASRALELLSAIQAGDEKRMKKLCKLQKSLY